jgi:hypothetical protein
MLVYWSRLWSHCIHVVMCLLDYYIRRFSEPSDMRHTRLYPESEYHSKWHMNDNDISIDIQSGTYALVYVLHSYHNSCNISSTDHRTEPRMCPLYSSRAQIHLCCIGIRFGQYTMEWDYCDSYTVWWNITFFAISHQPKKLQSPACAHWNRLELSYISVVSGICFKQYTMNAVNELMQCTCASVCVHFILQWDVYRHYTAQERYVRFTSQCSEHELYIAHAFLHSVCCYHNESHFGWNKSINSIFADVAIAFAIVRF